MVKLPRGAKPDFVCRVQPCERHFPYAAVCILPEAFLADREFRGIPIL